MFLKHFVNGQTHAPGYAYIPGIPTRYSLGEYSILRQVNFQGLRFTMYTYTLQLREVLISQKWHFFETKSKIGTEC